MQAGLSLSWSHIPHCWKSHVEAHVLSVRVENSVDPDQMVLLEFKLYHLDLECFKKDKSRLSRTD